MKPRAESTVRSAVCPVQGVVLYKLKKENKKHSASFYTVSAESPLIETEKNVVFGDFRMETD